MTAPCEDTKVTLGYLQPDHHRLHVGQWQHGVGNVALCKRYPIEGTWGSPVTPKVAWRNMQQRSTRPVCATCRDLLVAMLDPVTRLGNLT